MNMVETRHMNKIALRGVLRIGESMRRHTSWRVGGPADRCYTPADLDDLSVFLSTLAVNEPLTFFGLGSNILVRDGGIRGTVVFTHPALRQLELIERAAHQEVRVQAGVASPKIARFAAVHGFEGGEFLAGIPGTIGGALAMNAGCYGSETWDVVSQVSTIDRAGRIRQRNPEDYVVAYRSVVPVSSSEEYFVEAWLRFTPGDGDRSRQQIKTLLQKRIATQPLEIPNAGSVFRNPPGDHAARLIESCGLKGYRRGGAQVSPKHANFIVNVAQASARDIEDLIEYVSSSVFEKFGIRLEQEVRVIGEAAR